MKNHDVSETKVVMQKHKCMDTFEIVAWKPTCMRVVNPIVSMIWDCSIKHKCDDALKYWEFGDLKLKHVSEW
jgi:hypothetical protein